MSLEKNVNTRGNTDIDGNVYEHGIEAWIARWNFTEEISFASATFDVCDFTGTLSGKCVLIGSYNTTNFDTTVYFYGDDILLASYELKPDTIPFSIDISMEDVKKLKIYVQDNIGVAGGTSFGFVNMILNRSTEQPVKFTIGRDNNIFGNTSQDFLEMMEMIEITILLVFRIIERHYIVIKMSIIAICYRKKNLKSGKVLVME